MIFPLGLRVNVNVSVFVHCELGGLGVHSVTGRASSGESETGSLIEIGEDGGALASFVADVKF
jgi:hypothetical protein